MRGALTEEAESQGKVSSGSRLQGPARMSEVPVGPRSMAGPADRPPPQKKTEKIRLDAGWVASHLT